MGRHKQYIRLNIGRADYFRLSELASQNHLTIEEYVRLIIVDALVDEVENVRRKREEGSSQGRKGGAGPSGPPPRVYAEPYVGWARSSLDARSSGDLSRIPIESSDRSNSNGFSGGRAEHRPSADNGGHGSLSGTVCGDDA